jgi:hypothetical protein
MLLKKRAALLPAAYPVQTLLKRSVKQFRAFLGMAFEKVEQVIPFAELLSPACSNNFFKRPCAKLKCLIRNMFVKTNKKNSSLANAVYKQCIFNSN